MRKVLEGQFLDSIDVHKGKLLSYYLFYEYSLHHTSKEYCKRFSTPEETIRR